MSFLILRLFASIYKTVILGDFLGIQIIRHAQQRACPRTLFGLQYT